jgi:hypothetical protein
MSGRGHWVILFHTHTGHFLGMEVEEAYQESVVWYLVLVEGFCNGDFFSRLQNPYA